MYDVYAYATPNSVKVPIALEELGLAYTLHGVNVRAGEQKTSEFLALNPNGKVPVLVVRDGSETPFVLTESAAILVWLAEHTGQLLPQSDPARARVFEQLFFHASGLGPAFGQLGFFKRFASEPQEIALNRFETETHRVLHVLDNALAKSRYVAGDDYSIADIAHFGWLWRRTFPAVTLNDTPNIARWYDDIAARPAVVRGIERTNALTPQN